MTSQQPQPLRLSVDLGPVVERQAADIGQLTSQLYMRDQALSEAHAEIARLRELVPADTEKAEPAAEDVAPEAKKATRRSSGD